MNFKTLLVLKHAVSNVDDADADLNVPFAQRLSPDPLGRRH